jgi:hypothetical protein
MRRALLSFLALALAYSPTLFACGDKFLLIGRGATYRGRYVAIHPATILLYTPTAAGKSDVDVRRLLQRAGHRVDYAPDQTQLDAEMRSKAYDFVVVPVEMVNETERHIQSLTSTAVVLPIIYAATDEEVQKVEKEYDCIAKSKNTQRSFLAVLDDAMAMRLKGQAMNCNWTK